MENVNQRERPGKKIVSNDSNIPESVRNIDLGPIVFKLLLEESPVDWSEEKAVRVSEEYRKFLTLAKEGGGVSTVASIDIDLIWHQHILDTEKYYNDTMSAFGHFVHHFPYLGTRGEDDKKLLYNTYQKTLERYEKRFGTPPEDVWKVMAHCGASHCSGGGGGDDVGHGG